MNIVDYPCICCFNKNDINNIIQYGIAEDSCILPFQKASTIKQVRYAKDNIRGFLINPEVIKFAKLHFDSKAINTYCLEMAIKMKDYIPNKFIIQPSWIFIFNSSKGKPPISKLNSLRSKYRKSNIVTMDRKPSNVCATNAFLKYFKSNHRLDDTLYLITIKNDSTHRYHKDSTKKLIKYYNNIWNSEFGLRNLFASQYITYGCNLGDNKLLGYLHKSLKSNRDKELGLEEYRFFNIDEYSLPVAMGYSVTNSTNSSKEKYKL